MIFAWRRTDARLGVLIGSLVAAVVGSAICIPGTVSDDHSMDAARRVDDLERSAST